MAADLAAPGRTADDAQPTMDAHSMNPAVVLGDARRRMGGEVGRVLVVGCQPSVIDEGIGLSPPGRRRASTGRWPRSSRCSPSCACTNEERSGGVIRRLIWSLLLIALATLVVKSLPDLARYLKMREM